MARPTLEELADRLEIDDLLTRYATALDDKAFDALDSVFTPDAHIDYTSTGGTAGEYPAVKAWLADVLPSFPAYHHIVVNRRVAISGETAASVSVLFNPMVMANGDTFFCGAEYHDRLVRTPAGWRIAERIEKSVWNYGAVPAAPPA
jgi:3-phenylpropionate/cinnamic acid dioxygenase small subunit